MLRGIWGDPERYRDTYWSTYEGRYFAGDGCKIDDDGYFWLLGRVDDVMNVSGHRVSTTEVESALVDHPAVAEAAVVGATDETTGQAIIGYVILRGTFEASPELIEEIRQHVAKKIGPTARPKAVLVVPDLPKTRSGKIMRRLLRDVAEGRDLGDTTTLADAGVVEDIRRRAAETPGGGLTPSGIEESTDEHVEVRSEGPRDVRWSRPAQEVVGGADVVDPSSGAGRKGRGRAPHARGSTSVPSTASSSEPTRRCRRGGRGRPSRARPRCRPTRSRCSGRCRRC